ncbi:MAG TPA: strictosidine synthase [Rhizobiaceae bacterium]
MIGALKRAWANFRGFDLDGSTVPPMDGPLRPNSRLDAMPVLLRLEDVGNLVDAGGRLVCSVGEELLTLAQGEGGLAIAERRSLGANITAIASADGILALAVEGRGILIERPGSEPQLISGQGTPSACVTAMAFAGPSALFVAVGSAHNAAGQWKRDLMTKSASGSVWRIDLSNGSARQLARDLAFPSGIAVSGNGLFVSEAWRHRVRSLGQDGSDKGFALSGLPAYPGGIAPAASGGFWLAMFAPRNPLVEFVLKEDEYRRRMVETIDPAYWIAPSLLAGRSFLEPIQGGTRKKLNMLKPWSPTFSIGLVVRCDEHMGMQRSYHSRADGDVHGVTSLCESGGRVLAAAQGSGKIVAIEEMTEQAAA